MKLLGLILIVAGLVRERAPQQVSSWLWQNRRKVTAARGPLGTLLEASAPLARPAGRLLTVTMVTAGLLAAAVTWSPARYLIYLAWMMPLAELALFAAGQVWYRLAWQAAPEGKFTHLAIQISYNDPVTQGQYNLYHNPAENYSTVYGSSECHNVQPLSALNLSALPTVSFITPELL